MRFSSQPIVMSIIISCFIMLFLAGSSVSISNHYVEDFSTKQYCDTLNTTARWDTIAGALKLYPFIPTIIGTYDTPDEALDVTVSGDYAFVADKYTGLLIIDIFDPTNPVLVGTCDTPDVASDVAVSGDYAFVADRYSGLQIIDISDTTNPILIGVYDTPDQALDVTVSGDCAFVADRYTGLLVIDISDPTNPTLLGTHDTPVYAMGVTVAGDYAFVADETGGFHVIDISNPTNPILLGTCCTSRIVTCVTVSGDYAFVGDFTAGLRVINISDPTNPTLVGSCFTPGLSFGITFSGNYVLLTDGSAGLQVIDISDPTNPMLIGTCDTPDFASAVAFSGNHAFVADDQSGLQVINISERVCPPALAGNYNTPDDAMDVAVSGHHAFVSAQSSFQVIDISDPTNLTLVGSCNTPNNILGVTVSGDYAFTASPYGLQVIDILDPTNPTLAGSNNTLSYARNVAVAGDYAFLVGTSGLLVLDISDPTNPTLAGNYDTQDNAKGIAVSGDHAFIMDLYSLNVIDISDPTNPTLLGSYNTPDQTSGGIDISGDYAFVTYISGLQVIDISDPTNPTLAGSCNTPEDAYDVAVSGNYAFVADEYYFLVIDISDPSDPILIEIWDSPKKTTNVTVSGNYAFVVGGISLQAIQVFQNKFSTTENVGWSLAVDAANDTIQWAALKTTQTDTVTWELSADGGISWQDIAPNGVYNQLNNPGFDLVWRSTHLLGVPNVNPSVTHLEIEWLYEFPVIDSIWDIPNDQGRQVSISWHRSAHDYLGSTSPVAEYSIYRKIDYDLFTSSESSYMRDVLAKKIVETDDARSLLSYPPGDWHFITTIPAHCEDIYSVVVPTLADSTRDEGMYYSTFFVRAGTTVPSVYFDSYPDSGYSVDNLAPSVPTGLMVAYNTSGTTVLTWDECPDADFQYFCVYRGDQEDFNPSHDNFEKMTILPAWTDSKAGGYYYKVTAVDFNGNESEAASPEYVTGVVTPSMPEAFVLYQNVPNPFNPSTRINFDLPRAAYVKLYIYDVSGKLIRALVDAELSPGNKELLWDGRDNSGRETASGIYFYQFTAGTFTETKKMVLLK